MPDKYNDELRGERRPYQGRETRSFGEEGRFSSDQARYYGADTRSYGARLHDPAGGERMPWRSEHYDGRRDEDHGYRSFEGDFHGGQEYGMPASQRSGRRGYAGAGGDDLGYDSRRRGRETAFSDMAYGDQPLPHDRGAREFGPPADYAYHPTEQDLEPDYVAWRDAQMRSHDRDYAAWRADQHKRYDEDYRTFRSERKTNFHKSFGEWSAQRQTGGEASPDAKPTPDDKV